jgi:serine/threonine protein kinase
MNGATTPTIAEFDGDRFQTIRRLGVGGMGVVYEVLDRQRNTHVALKTLLKVDAAGIYRFKREFRALADITHRNLISLYELMSTDRRWFFTMELLDGEDFVRYVRRGQVAPSPPADYLASTVIDGTRKPTMAAGAVSPPQDLERLRSGLRQLVEGVAALHVAGKVHRDIKPSNVLVCRDGRVVLLDFGLVSDLPLPLAQGSTVGQFAGTPAYMSPEQLTQRAVGPESDWYSVGLVLHQALTGVLPHTHCENILELASLRQERPVPSPRQLCPELPADLDELCQELLDPDPTRRPTADVVLRRVAGTAPVMIAPPRAPVSIFVGRDHELLTLGKAAEAARQQQTTVAHVWGDSGIGKSAVLDHFLHEQAMTQPATVILRGRCYERESVPYKALDRWRSCFPCSAASKRCCRRSRRTKTRARSPSRARSGAWRSWRCASCSRASPIAGSSFSSSTTCNGVTRTRARSWPRRSRATRSRCRCCSCSLAAAKSGRAAHFSAPFASRVPSRFATSSSVPCRRRRRASWRGGSCSRATASSDRRRSWRTPSPANRAASRCSSASCSIICRACKRAATSRSSAPSRSRRC